MRSTKQHVNKNHRTHAASGASVGVFGRDKTNGWVRKNEIAFGNCSLSFRTLQWRLPWSFKRTTKLVDAPNGSNRLPNVDVRLEAIAFRLFRQHFVCPITTTANAPLAGRPQMAWWHRNGRNLNARYLFREKYISEAFLEISQSTKTTCNSLRFYLYLRSTVPIFKSLSCSCSGDVLLGVLSLCCCSRTKCCLPGLGNSFTQS